MIYLNIQSNQITLYLVYVFEWLHKGYRLGFHEIWSSLHNSYES